MPDRLIAPRPTPTQRPLLTAGPPRRVGRLERRATSNALLALLLLLLTALATAGCHSPSTKSKPNAASSAAKLDVTTDPCARRLHEASGALLLYYAEHGKLPPTLNDLASVPGATDAGELVCPVSHDAYLYFPDGEPSPDGDARIVIADAKPVHAGMRWAVVVLPPTNGPLIAKVIAIPESAFPKTSSAASSSAQGQRVEGGR
jgi:hypothetical protein